MVADLLEGRSNECGVALLSVEREDAVGDLQASTRSAGNLSALSQAGRQKGREEP